MPNDQREKSQGEKTPLLKQVSKSGVPFEIAVEHILRQTYQEHHWDVIATQFPWSEGYVDLVLRRRHVLMFIECKRVFDGDWIFPLAGDSKLSVERCRLDWFNGRADDGSSVPASRRRSRVFCDEFSMMSPESPESEHCIIKKGGAVDTLEPIARDLLNAGREIGDHKDLSHEHHFEPLISLVLTTARLLTCQLEPDEQLAHTGIVDDASFEEQRLIRFRKSLATHRSDAFSNELVTLGDFKADRERTVLVAQARAFLDVLKGIKGPVYEKLSPAPPRFHTPPEISP